MSLRARIASAAALAGVIVMVVAGILTVRLTERDERSALDQQLSAQAQTLSGPVTRLVGSPLTTLLDRAGAAGIDGDRTIRVVTDSGAATLTVGVALPGALGLVSSGASTVVIGGERFRIFALPGGSRHPLIARRTGASTEQVQVIAPLAPLDAQARSIRRRVLVVSGCGVVVIVILAWLFTGAALVSLRRLRDIADEVATTDDLTRRIEPMQPPEIGAVVAAFNAMLGRLHRSSEDRQQALDTARAFAADAMHELRTPLTSMGATLEALDDRPAAERTQLTRELLADHARIVSTLELLNALTVAEVTPVDGELVDLADVIEVLANESPRRHPGIVVAVDLPADPVEIRGSREAVRMAIDNLLTNAERHGRASGTTQVRIRVGLDLSGNWGVTVDDDGAGFPAADRERLLDRFVRGSQTSPGSGLGLAIVAQQVRRHGGSIRLGGSDLGGASVGLTFPAIS